MIAGGVFFWDGTDHRAGLIATCESAQPDA
jgi:hypothetical protein